MQKVLCVCRKGTARSVMMRAILQKALGNEYRVESAGTEKNIGHRPDSRAVLCMRERGIDVSDHNGRWIGHLKDLGVFSHIVCVDRNAAAEVLKFIGGKSVKILIADEGRGIPLSHDDGYTAFQDCAALLDKDMSRIAKLIRG